MLDSVTDIDIAFSDNLYLNGQGNTVGGFVVDTANFEPGIVFYIAKSQSNGGACAIMIQESDDELSGFSDIPSECLIGSLEGIADNVVNYGEPMPSVGVFSSKRYLRLSMTVTGGGQDPGDNTIVLCFVGRKGEILPNA